jgi:hypothetical protein
VRILVLPTTMNPNQTKAKLASDRPARLAARLRLLRIHDPGAQHVRGVVEHANGAFRRAAKNFASIFPGLPQFVSDCSHMGIVWSRIK